MKKALTTEFKTNLWQTIRTIEKTSQVEVVVIVRNRSADYHDVSLTWGIITAFTSFAYVIFAPEFYTDWTIFYLPIIAFSGGYAVAHLHPIIRFSVKKSRLLKNVEIMARAFFQKGGVQHTQAKIGLLIYCSWLEKTVYLLPDKGLEMALPQSEWQQLQTEFQQIFNHRQPNIRLLEQLAKTQLLFNHYLPASAKGINELPDIMEIDL